LYSDAGVHGARFDGLDEAFDGQGNGVGAIAKVEGASRISFRIGCMRSTALARAKRRLDQVMQIGVANVIQPNLTVGG